jgi:hypothetical protein
VYAPIVEGSDQIDRQGQLAQELARRSRLIPSRHYRSRIGVKIILAKPLRLARGGTKPALLIKVKPRPEDLECLAIVQPARDDGTKNRRERVPRNTQPVGPCPILASLVDDALAHVEDHSADRAFPGYLRYRLPRRGPAGFLAG